MNVSRPLTRRLPLYLNYLKTHREEYPYNISSRELAKALGLGEVLVRKDLAKVTSGGRAKTGHVCENLIADIEAFLNYNQMTDAILVGAGKLGQALLGYSGFEKVGLNILAGFDIAVSKKQMAGSKPVYPMSQLESFCRKHNVRLGIITVPPDQAQVVCYALISSGILAIWNFAPVHLDAPVDVLIQNENLAASLTALRMNMEARFPNPQDP